MATGYIMQKMVNPWIIPDGHSSNLKHIEGWNAYFRPADDLTMDIAEKIKDQKGEDLRFILQDLLDEDLAKVQKVDPGFRNHNIGNIINLTMSMGWGMLEVEKTPGFEMDPKGLFSLENTTELETLLAQLSKKPNAKTKIALAKCVAEPYLNAVKAMNDDCLYTLLNHIHPNSYLRKKEHFLKILEFFDIAKPEKVAKLEQKLKAFFEEMNQGKVSSIRLIPTLFELALSGNRGGFSPLPYKKEVWTGPITHKVLVEASDSLLEYLKEGAQFSPDEEDKMGHLEFLIGSDDDTGFDRGHVSYMAMFVKKEGLGPSYSTICQWLDTMTQK